MTKIDAMTDDEIIKFQTSLEETLDKRVLALSSVSHQNLELLTNLMFKALGR